MDSCCLLFGSIALWEKVIYDFPFDSRPATKCKEKKIGKTEFVTFCVRCSGQMKMIAVRHNSI